MRRKEDRRVAIALRGTRERGCRCSSHVRPQGGPPSLRGTGVVPPLGVSSGHLPERYPTYATGWACGAGRRGVRVADPR